MARKVKSRMDLRAEADAAEALEKVAPKKKKAKKKTTKKKAAKRKTRVAAEVRLKAFWGVFNQSLRRVALFEYGERKEADEKAKSLAESSKIPHFVQIVKEVIDE